MGQVVSFIEQTSSFSEDESLVYSKINLGLVLRSFGRVPGGSFRIEFSAPASIFFWSREEVVELLKRLSPHVMWEQMVIFSHAEESSIEIVNPDTDLICGRIFIRREISSGEIEGENIILLRGA